MAEAVVDILTYHNYLVDAVSDGEDALSYALSETYDGIILDIMMPKLSGLEVLQRLRAAGCRTPILLLTAKTEVEDRIQGLDAGADDYLPKPFAMGELLARIRVALRRVRYDSQKTSAEAALYENGDLKIDYAGGRACCRGAEMKLTPMEYKLLCLLAKNTGKVLTHNYLLNEVWGSPAASDTPSLRVFMATLRKKIEEDPSHPRYIQTHIGVGYRMIRQ